MKNNIFEVERELRSIAKRVKSIKYSIGLVITFLMTGVGVFSEEINVSQANETSTNEKTVLSRKNLEDSVKNLQTKLNEIKSENDKTLDGARLELIKLMEQGNQVVKSPWSSWQFGVNYMYDKGKGAYKGAGDKAEKYPYEGIFTRSTNAFVRSTNIQNTKKLEVYNEFLKDLEKTKSNSPLSINREIANKGKNYGLLERKIVEEEPYTMKIGAGIYPKTITVKDVKINVDYDGIPTHAAPPTPNINIPSFSPVAPKVEVPEIPVPPTFAVVLGADCNDNCNSNSNKRQEGQGKPELYPGKQNLNAFLHYTWTSESVPDKETRGLAFKMYAETKGSKDFILGTTQPTVKNKEILTVKDWYFNSYNTGTEFKDQVSYSHLKDNEKNHQAFFVGGSRFIESDNAANGIDNKTGEIKRRTKIEIPEGHTVHLGGILTLALVSQGDNTHELNAGKITDIEENQDDYIKKLEYDKDGEGKDKYRTIIGPGTAKYQIKRSNDGYVGYKVGIALVQEQGTFRGILENKGTIDFRGERTIGMYTYLPGREKGNININNESMMINNKDILLSGKESYGMKIAADFDLEKREPKLVKMDMAIYPEMINGADGVITLRKNPDSTKGDLADRADNSTGMALMADETVNGNVNFEPGKAVNKGKIKLQDNISNSLGMFINIGSNMTNQGEINVNALAQKDDTGKYKPNVAMRADQVKKEHAIKKVKRIIEEEVNGRIRKKNIEVEKNVVFDTAVINDTAGKININGQAGIAMFAQGKVEETGTAQAINKGTITIDENTETEEAKKSKANFGMFSAKEAQVTNESDGKIFVKNSEDSVGMVSLVEGTGETAKVSKSENKGIIEASGERTTAVYNSGEFLMDNENARVSVSAKQSIGIYAKGMEAKTKTLLKAGTVVASNSGTGLYSDNSKITLDNTKGKLNLIADRDGLLFYNYQSNQTQTASGRFELIGTNENPVQATIKDGGYGFYLKGATITNGIVPGVNAFLDGMFIKDPSVPKLKIGLKDGGTLMILEKPQGGALTLSGASTVQNINTSLGDKVEINAASSGKYKVYSVYRGKLKLDQDVNLDNTMSTANPDAYYRVDFRSSNMTLDAGKTITGTKEGEMALFQGNYNEEGGEVGTLDDVKIINNGKISLKGNSTASKTTTAMAGDFVTLTNNKDIEVTGDNAIGIFGSGGSKILNDTTGTITVGKQGVGLYSINKLGNSLLGDNKINITNKGKILAAPGKELPYGIYAKNKTNLVAVADAKVINEGTIDFSKAIKGVGIYAGDLTLNNTGKILAGEKGTGIYSTGATNTQTSGDITVGANGAGLYIKSSGATTNTGKITIGENSTGIYTEGTGTISHSGAASIESTADKAKGIVVKNDTAGDFSNDAKIKLTGVSSVGVYSSGKDRTFTNNGSIEVGDSNNSNQSIGIYMLDSGKVKNFKTVKSGNKSIGIYGKDVILEDANSVVEVGDGATAIYSKDGDIELKAGSKITIGKTLGEGQEAIGVYHTGTEAKTINNKLQSLTMGEGSIGLIVAGSGATTLNNDLANVKLRGNSVYTYTTNTNSTVNGRTKITSTGNGNYGYYVAGNLTNERTVGDIDFSSGVGNVGIYSAYSTGNGVARNYADIKVGKTDLEKELYGIGMAAGYWDKDEVSKNRKGYVVNEGNITVGNSNSIGMFASGIGSTAENNGNIDITAKNGIGMYLESGARGINGVNGKITIEPGAEGAIGVYATGNGTTFKNYGTIEIKANSSKGIVIAKRASLETESVEPTIASGVVDSKKIYEGVGLPAANQKFGDKEFVIKQGVISPTVVKSKGEVLKPDVIDINDKDLELTKPNGIVEKLSNAGRADFGETASKIGMYVDTSGVNFTNPIKGLENLKGLKKADLIIGAEAADYTNAKTISVGKNILGRYNKAIEKSRIDEWEILSGSLTWSAKPLKMDEDTRLLGVVMSKTDYKEYVGKDDNAYNFLDGLEQRYDKNALDSREKKVFNKLNSIGKNEGILLSQAFDEMMGHQYANVQQRIYQTGSILDKEFSYLRNEWQNVSKDSNKIKTFGTKGEYRTSTAGVHDYTNNAYGVAYVHENETLNLGKTSGWYTGIVENRIKFKDIGGSKEEQLQGKIGVFKSIPFDYDNSLNWTVSGELSLGYNKMNRRFWVVDDVFNAKSRYWNYGAAIKNEVSKDFRLSEDFSFKPYASARVEYGRISKIREKSGEIKLEVKSNDYYSIKPEIGSELIFKHVANNKTFKATLGIAYENELGKIANGKNKARVLDTTADWFNIRGEKEDRHGNVKTDLKIGVDNSRVGLTANIGYDTKGRNVRGGVGLRVIF